MPRGLARAGRRVGRRAGLPVGFTTARRLVDVDQNALNEILIAQQLRRDRGV